MLHVAECEAKLMRICAPDTPYTDEELKVCGGRHIFAPDAIPGRVRICAPDTPYTDEELKVWGQRADCGSVLGGRKQ